MINFFNKNNDISIGKGIDLLSKELKLREIKIKESSRPGHMLVFGSTRIGKSYLESNMVRQDIRKGNNVVVFDPKGDIDLISALVEEAKINDRLDDLFFVNPLYPDYSAPIAPLKYYTIPEEIVGHVVAGVQAKEEFFLNVAEETTMCIVGALIAFNDDDPENAKTITFKELHQRCSAEELLMLKYELEKLNRTEKIDETIAIIDKVTKTKPEFFNKVTSSLRTVLTQMRSGSTGAILGNVTENGFIKKLENNEKVIMIVQTGCMITKRSGHVMGRVLLSMLQAYIARKQASGAKLSPPLCIYMDEFSNIIYRGIADLFSKSGGTNVYLTAFTQSIYDLENVVGPHEAAQILDNTNSKIYMRVNNNDTAKYISQQSPEVIKKSNMLTSTGQILQREGKEPLILESDATTQNVRDFYYFGFEGIFKGRTHFNKTSGILIEYPELITQGM
ncbi:MAG: type IV secretory system conjugative DNA transfer family protein [Desulfobacterales bacterium]|nr:type IV secretory system conjugative DNA transfer family protein [Desulfobacterales bacterium]